MPSDSTEIPNADPLASRPDKDPTNIVQATEETVLPTPEQLIDDHGRLRVPPPPPLPGSPARPCPENTRLVTQREQCPIVSPPRSAAERAATDRALDEGRALPESATFYTDEVTACIDANNALSGPYARRSVDKHIHRTDSYVRNGRAAGPMRSEIELDGSTLLDYQIGPDENGRRRGMHHSYVDGAPLHTNTYVNGRSVRLILWYPSGHMRSDAQLVADRLHGLVTTWHENGAKASEVFYREGDATDKTRYWDESGEQTTDLPQ